MENQLNTRKVINLHSLVPVGAITGVTEAIDTSSKPGGKRQEASIPTRNLLQMWQRKKTENTRKSFGTLCAEAVERRGTLGRSVSKLNVPHIQLEVPQASTSSAGAGASEPLYFDDDGQPIFTHMVSVLHANKHLIKFPIALDYMTHRGRKKMENSTDSTGHTNCSTMLLKADTGADVNLMNKQTFNQLFGMAKDLLQLTSIRMENYGNSAVKVLGIFHAFLRWKGKVYKQTFHVTECDRSPNLLSRDACYTLGVLKPCYTMGRTAWS